MQSEGILQTRVPIIDSFIQLIRLCVDDDYFWFRDQYQQQSSGLSIGGSLLSPVFITFYVEYFVSAVLATHPVPFILGLRFVDDVFAV